MKAAAGSFSPNGTTATPSVSVAICAHTFDRLEQTTRCVASVLEGARTPDELIVAVDENPALAARFRELLPDGVRVIDSEGSGAAAARTTALRQANSDVVAFIDDDAYAEAEWLQAIAAVFGDPDVMGAGGRVDPDWEDPRVALPDEIYWVVGATYRGHRVDAGPISRPIGANMAVRRVATLETGGFPSAFGPRAGAKLSSNEELAAFSAITARYGEECVRYVPSAVVHHFAPVRRCTFGYVLRRSAVEGRSKADVRLLFGPASMAADRSYVRDVVGSGIARHVASAWRERRLGHVRSSALIAAAFVMTASNYVLRLASQRARGIGRSSGRPQ